MTGAGPAEDLKDAIRWRVNFITSDCNTFVLVKSQHPEVIGTWEYGGGDFLMASGLFALVNFLSKVHRYLVDPNAFVTDDYRAKVESAKAELVSKHPELKGILEHFLRARVGEVNELESFQKFVVALRAAGIDLGIPDHEGKTAGRIWRAFRNPLAHMAGTAGGSIAAHDSFAGKTLAEARDVIRAGFKAFFRSAAGEWICNSDRLNVEIEPIFTWLAAQIDTAPAERIEAALAWVKRQEASPWIA